MPQIMFWGASAFDQDWGGAFLLTPVLAGCSARRSATVMIAASPGIAGDNGKCETPEPSSEPTPEPGDPTASPVFAPTPRPFFNARKRSRRRGP